MCKFLLHDFALIKGTVFRVRALTIILDHSSPGWGVYVVWNGNCFCFRAHLLPLKVGYSEKKPSPGSFHPSSPSRTSGASCQPSSFTMRCTACWLPVSQNAGRRFENIAEMEVLFKRYNIPYVILGKHGTFAEQVSVGGGGGVRGTSVPLLPRCSCSPRSPFPLVPFYTPPTPPVPVSLPFA